MTELTELPKPASRWTPFVLRALAHLTLELDGRAIHLEPGAVFTATAEQASGLLERFPTQLERLDLPLDPPAGPLQPGWLVVYYDRAGRLVGGADDRANGTVQACDWNGSGWTVTLTNGQTIPLSIIRSVGRTDAHGMVVEAWTVRAHGYDGRSTASTDSDWLTASAGPPQAVAESACFACGGTRQWESIHGAVICGVCHPPASANLIVGWIGGEGGEHETGQA